MALAFSSRTQAWLPYLDDSSGRGGVGFQQAWIQKESDGNPCSYPCKNGYCTHESGIAQLNPENMSYIGMNEAQLHPIPPCVAGAETRSTSLDSLTSDQAQTQANSLLGYIDYCTKQVRIKLAHVGAQPWDESQPDFWQMVKYCHALPGAQTDILAQMSSNPPQSWDDFKTFANATNCAGHGCGTTITNATSVGAYGGSDPSPSIVDQIIVLSGPPQEINWWMVGLVALGGLAIGIGLYQRRAHRRIGHAA